MIRGLSRRAFVASLAALAASPAMVFRPQNVDAQPPTSPRHIGVLAEGGVSPTEAQAFRQGLREAGYAEGRDVVIEWRYAAGGDYAQVSALATDLLNGGGG